MTCLAVVQTEGWAILYSIPNNMQDTNQNDLISVMARLDMTDPGLGNPSFI